MKISTSLRAGSSAMLGHGWAFLTAQQVKNPPVRQETQEAWVRSLGQEDLLEEEMAIRSVFLPWVGCCWHTTFLDLLAASRGLELPKFLDQWPEAKSIFIHSSYCHKTLSLSNFAWLEEDWEASICTLNLLAKNLDFPLCWIWGTMPANAGARAPQVTLRNNHMNIVVIHSNQAQTVLTNCV